AHRRRPLLDDVACGPLLADVLPDRLPAQPFDELRAERDGDHHRDEACDQDPHHAWECFWISSGMPSRPTDRDPLTRIASPGRSTAAIGSNAPASGTSIPSSCPER